MDILFGKIQLSQKSLDHKEKQAYTLPQQVIVQKIVTASPRAAVRTNGDGTRTIFTEEKNTFSLQSRPKPI